MMSHIYLTVFFFTLIRYSPQPTLGVLNHVKKKEQQYAINEGNFFRTSSAGYPSEFSRGIWQGWAFNLEEQRVKYKIKIVLKGNDLMSNPLK